MNGLSSRAGNVVKLAIYQAVVPAPPSPSFSGQAWLIYDTIDLTASQSRDLHQLRGSRLWEFLNLRQTLVRPAGMTPSSHLKIVRL